jgi:hypothetical protein
MNKTYDLLFVFVADLDERTTYDFNISSVPSGVKFDV